MVSYEVFFRVADLAEARREVYFSEIPEALREDFNRFIIGRTIAKRGDDLVSYPGDVFQWYEQPRTKGVDYDLILDIHPNTTRSESSAGDSE